MRRKGEKAAGVCHSYSSRGKMGGREETTNGGNMNRESKCIKQNRIGRGLKKQGKGSQSVSLRGPTHRDLSSIPKWAIDAFHVIIDHTSTRCKVLLPGKS